MQRQTARLLPLGDPFVCSGGALGGGPFLGSALFGYWATHDCPSAYAAILNSSPEALGKLSTLNCTAGASCVGGTGSATVFVQQYNPKELKTTQNFVSDLFATYNLTNQITADPSSPEYSPFQETLLQLCLDPRLPGACDAFLRNFCPGFTGIDPVSVGFCGCYRKAPQSVAAADTNVPPQCSPLCHRAGTVQLADPNTGQLQVCDPNVCVIDDVTVSLTASQIGGVNVVNFCPGCGAGGKGCFCLISGVDVSQTMSQVGLGVNFKQYCGPNSVCIQGTKTVDCQQEAGKAASLSAVGNSRPPWGFLIFLLIVVVLVGLAFWAAKYWSPKHRPKTRKSGSREAQRKRITTSENPPLLLSVGPAAAADNYEETGTPELSPEAGQEAPSLGNLAL